MNMTTLFIGFIQPQNLKLKPPKNPHPLPMDYLKIVKIIWSFGAIHKSFFCPYSRAEYVTLYKYFLIFSIGPAVAQQCGATAAAGSMGGDSGATAHDNATLLLPLRAAGSAKLSCAAGAAAA